MGKQPLVSAITIFLNGEQFIEEAIASICAQTYDNWELLLVDDGSSDKSTQIARRYAAQCPGKIRYLEHRGHQNRGMGASRNIGVVHAKGEFIAFLDADDVWMPNKLAEQVALAQAYPEAAMLYGRTLIWHSWTNKPEDENRDSVLDLGVRHGQLAPPPRLFLTLLENKAQSPTTCNALIRRDVVIKVGGCEESFRGMYEDQVLFAKIELQWPVYVAAQCWAKYRQHSANCSAARFTAESYCSTRLPFLNWLSAHLIRTGVARTSPVWKAVQTHTWLCRHPRYFQLANQICFRKKQLAELFARIRADRQTFALS